MSSLHKLRTVLLTVAVTAAGTIIPINASGWAEELRVGTQFKLMTLDPHFADLNENTSLLSHIYERLVYQDEHLDPKPGLAFSWKRLSQTQWEFKLREGVRFHDGSAFTAEDVIYSIERVRDFLNPPNFSSRSIRSSLRAIWASLPASRACAAISIAFRAATSSGRSAVSSMAKTYQILHRFAFGIYRAESSCRSYSMVSGALVWTA